MLRDFWVATIALTWMATPAASAEIVAKGAGGVFCEDIDEMKLMIMATLAKSKAPAPKSCITVSAGTTFEALKVESLGDELAMGYGTYTNSAGIKKEGAFMVSTVTAVEKPKLSSAGRKYKRIGPVDVRNTPTKWAGRDIEFANVNVYWVDEDDVRFITGTSLTLFGKHVRGTPADLAYLKENCETQDEALSRKCKVTVRFQYEEHAEDKPGGMATRTVLRSDDIEALRMTGKR